PYRLPAWMENAGQCPNRAISRHAYVHELRQTGQCQPIYLQPGMPHHILRAEKQWGTHRRGPAQPARWQPLAGDCWTELQLLRWTRLPGSAARSDRALWRACTDGNSDTHRSDTAGRLQERLGAHQSAGNAAVP